MNIKKHRIHITRKALIALVIAAVVAAVLGTVFMISARPRTVHITGSSNIYYIDEEQFSFTNEPYICDGAVYIPANDLLAQFGYASVFDSESGILTITTEKRQINIYADKNIIFENGENTSFSLPAMKRGGIVYLPSEMFSYFSRDEFEFTGEFKFVERPYRDLMSNTYIDDTYRLEGSVERYNGVYVVDGKAAMEILYYPESNCVAYAEVINSLAEALPDVKVFDVAIPSMSEFYGPQSLYTDQISGIRKIYENLNENIMPVNVIKEMWPHANEHLYFSTDHHWTQRGAYYAYKAFIKAKGEEIPELDKFPQNNTDGFVGSWKNILAGTSGEAALNSNPETLERFMPIASYSGEVYLDMRLTDKWRDSRIIDETNNTYTTFLGGDMPIIKYTTSVKNGEKAVIIKESFGNAFATWAINNYEEVYIIDPREWNNFNSASNGEFNLVTFYNEVCKFDDLIVVSYPGSASSGMRRAISALIGE